MQYRNIVVIDDDFIESYITERMILISSLTEKIKKYDSAEKALLDLSRNQEKSQHLPDIIFLDLNMPDMDGFDFLEKYDALHEDAKRKVKIVILSSSTNPDDYRRAIGNKHVFRYLSKPLQIKDLDSLVQ